MNHPYNRSEFVGEGAAARAQLEGFRQGSYVRIKIKGLPSEVIYNYTFTYTYSTLHCLLLFYCVQLEGEYSDACSHSYCVYYYMKLIA
jgi:hypothetical protein